MESLVFLEPQDLLVNPDSLVSPGHQEAKGTLDSQELDFLDPQELKVSLVSLVSPELLEEQVDLG